MAEIAFEIKAVEFGWPGREPIIWIDTLQVKRGERVFLSGPSGSGKSTLLGLVGGVLVPRKGSVRVLGTQVDQLRSSRRDSFRGDHIGFIFQMFNLIPYLSVLENVLLPLKFSPGRRKRLGAGAHSEALRLLSTLGLSEAELLSRSVMQLSMGQQQRVAVARALIGRPELIIADEPTSALDTNLREDFLRLLMQECRDFDTTLLFVSHDHALSAQFDRCVAMSDINRPRLPRSLQ